MSYTTLATVNWGTGPQIPITFYYDYQRSGADMQYKVKVVISPITGRSYFGYPIYTTISLDEVAKVSEQTLKNASPSQWSSSITFETDWLTVSGKSTGATALGVRLYSGLGSSRDTTYNYSLLVSPAATVPTSSVPSVGLGSAVTINTPRASSSFTHKLKYKFGNASGTIATSVATSKSWTPPLSLASQIPNDVSGVCVIVCETYDGGALIGTKTINLTLTVPATVVPTISAVNIVEATSGLAAQFAAYVQNKSTLSVAITAAGAYGSTITKYETTILGAKYTGASFTSQILNAAGSVSVATTVTDSRGRSTTRASIITVLEYFPPRINSMRAYRINTGGVAAEEGTRIAVAMGFKIADVGTRNSRAFTLQYKKSGEPDTSFITFSSGTPSWDYSGTQSFTSSPEISTDYAYIVRLTVTDYFGSARQDYEVSTAAPLLDFHSSGAGLGIGKVSELKKYLQSALVGQFQKGLIVGSKAAIPTERSATLNNMLAPLDIPNKTFTKLASDPVPLKNVSLASPGGFGPYCAGLEPLGTEDEVSWTLRCRDVGELKPHLTPSHIYYACAWVRQNSKLNGSVDLYWPIAEPPIFSGKTISAKNAWQKVSARVNRSTFAEGDYPLRFDYNNNKSNAPLYFTEIALYDLTATFGAGKEPDLAWCDANLDYEFQSITVLDPTYEITPEFICDGHITGKYIQGTWLKTTETHDYTGDTSRFCVLDSQGWVYTKTVEDFVIEKGTSGIWTYRKWNSGLAECWGRYELSGVQCNSDVGSWFKTDYIYLPQYPFTFAEDPEINMFFDTHTGTGGLVWSSGYDSKVQTTPKVKPNAIYIIRMTSSDSISGCVNAKVIGRWK